MTRLIIAGLAIAASLAAAAPAGANAASPTKFCGHNEAGTGRWYWKLSSVPSGAVNMKVRATNFPCSLVRASFKYGFSRDWRCRYTNLGWEHSRAICTARWDGLRRGYFKITWEQAV